MKFLITLVALVCQVALITAQTVYPGCPYIADPNVPKHIPIPGSCSKFVHCDNNGVGWVKDCAASDPMLIYDLINDRCVWPSETTRSDCTWAPSAPKGSEAYPGCPMAIDPLVPTDLETSNSCNGEFVRCFGQGMGMVYKCPEPFVFDSTYKTCVDRSVSRLCK